jgi:hypothetical protein
MESCPLLPTYKLFGTLSSSLRYAILLAYRDDYPRYLSASEILLVLYSAGSTKQKHCILSDCPLLVWTRERTFSFDSIRIRLEIIVDRTGAFESFVDRLLLVSITVRILQAVADEKDCPVVSARTEYHRFRIHKLS